ncbi:NUDIX hydrolase [Bosea sp. TAF32]|uniref:NUDIX hydrolase n=1 Tax=Bosea sp. TAF32 TaxID=3237482 RepID=UPI003F911645
MIQKLRGRPAPACCLTFDWAAILASATLDENDPLMKKLQGKAKLQVGALPLRRNAAGEWEILLVTTRSTKRWTVPKGWPIKKLKAHEAAGREALEEAGVVGPVKRKPVGRSLYWKRLQASFSLCKVRLYPMHVTQQLAHWPEEAQRLRHWFSLKDASDLVEEPGLRKVLATLKPER